MQVQLYLKDKNVRLVCTLELFKCLITIDSSASFIFLLAEEQILTHFSKTNWLLEV